MRLTVLMMNRETKITYYKNGNIKSIETFYDSIKTLQEPIDENKLMLKK